MITRELFMNQIRRALQRSRIVVLTGPRQCGKTTLARSFVKESSPHYFDLEDPVSKMRLNEPMTIFSRLKGLIVIDEVQRLPDLFSILRVLADRKNSGLKFLLLGSISPELMKNVSESLAGRTEIYEMTPFGTHEIHARNSEKLWLRGGFPRSFLAKSASDSDLWRKNYIETFLRLDMPLLGINVSAENMRRFWFMLAHYHGQIWNAANPARSLGVNESTTRRYLDILTGLYIIRQLPPWHENLGKRQIKSPKIFFRDSGILHHMLGIRTGKELFLHPKMGSSWEGFITEEILRQNRNYEAYFWGTHAGAELDLLLVGKNKKIGVEIKYSDAPIITTSMKTAMLDLGLEKILIVYPGTRSYSLAKNLHVLPFKHLLTHNFVL